MCWPRTHLRDPIEDAPPRRLLQLHEPDAGGEQRERPEGADAHHDALAREERPVGELHEGRDHGRRHDGAADLGARRVSHEPLGPLGIVVHRPLRGAGQREKARGEGVCECG